MSACARPDHSNRAVRSARPVPTGLASRHRVRQFTTPPLPLRSYCFNANVGLDRRKNHRSGPLSLPFHASGGQAASAFGAQSALRSLPFRGIMGVSIRWRRRPVARRRRFYRNNPFLVHGRRGCAAGKRMTSRPFGIHNGCSIPSCLSITSNSILVLWTVPKAVR